MSGLPAFYTVATYPLLDEIALLTIRGEEVARFSGMTPMASVRRVAHAHDEVRQLLACERAALREEPQDEQTEAYLDYLSARLAKAHEAYRRELVGARKAERRRIA